MHTFRPPSLQRHVRSTFSKCQPLHLRPNAQTISTKLNAAAAPGLRAEPWRGTPEQLKALESLRSRMSAKGHTVDDSVLQWYLRDRYFDVEEADQKLSSMLRWKRDFRPEQITAESVWRELQSGKAYVHSQPDKFGRPTIVIRSRLHVVGEYPIGDSKRLCVHLIDSAVNQAVSSGGEQILGIFDLRGFQVPRNSDLQFMAFLVEAFFEYYPRRVGQVLFVDAPWVFQPAWAAIQPLMRKYAALVRFVSVDDLRREFFTPDTLPPDFR